MTPEVTAELNRKEGPKPLREALLRHAMSRVKGSRSKMSKFYSDWDLQDQVYRGERELDEDDVVQERKGGPTKMIVPNTFAQVESFSAFLFLMFNQNRTLFELQPQGDEDHGTKHKDCEQVLEAQMRKNEKNRLLYQHLTDVGRFGPAIFSCEWVRKVQKAKFAQPPVVINMGGIQVETAPQSEWHDVVKYEGNEIRNVSPYRWFPDTAFPLSDFTRGDFCAYEEEYTMADLRTMAEAGEVAGVDNILPLPTGWSTERGGATRSIANFTATRGTSGTVACGHAEQEGPVLVTKCRMWIVPSKFEYAGKDKKLGPEEHKVLYHLWYANDNTLIRVEPAEEWHGSFGMSLSQFTPDMHHTVNLGLANLVYRLQDVMSWFINSHIKSVRRTIANRLIVNLDAVEPRSLDGEGDIYLKKGFGRRNWNEAVGQLQVSDVTGGHMADSQMLNGLMQMVTGVNDNAMGQYNGGRRSAQEARVVTAGAAGRMKMHGHLIWETGLAPLAQMMLSNSRQSLSAETFNRIVGAAAKADPNRFLAFQGTPEEVIGGDDYFMFDSTLASEKGFMAQSLQELLSTILTVNPAAALQIAQRMDPAKMVEEIQYLRGGGNVSRFAYAQGQGPMMPQPQLVNNPAAAV